MAWLCKSLQFCLGCVSDGFSLRNIESKDRKLDNRGILEMKPIYLCDVLGHRRLGLVFKGTVRHGFSSLLVFLHIFRSGTKLMTSGMAARSLSEYLK